MFQSLEDMIWQLAGKMQKCKTQMRDKDVPQLFTKWYLN